MCEHSDHLYIISLFRFFTDLAKPVRRYSRFTWIVMWKWVGPIVMFVIFVASVISEIIDPLTYTVYSNVSRLNTAFIAVLPPQEYCFRRKFCILQRSIFAAELSYIALVHFLQITVQ